MPSCRGVPLRLCLSPAWAEEMLGGRAHVFPREKEGFIYRSSAVLAAQTPPQNGFRWGYRVLFSEAERRKRRASAGHKVSGWGAQAAIKSRRYGELLAEPQLPVARYQDTDTEREFLPTDTKIPKFFPSITCSSWALASQSSTEVTVSSPSFQHTLGCAFRSSHSYRKPGVPMTG